MNESREGFCRRGRGRSFHVDGPKSEKAREPAVESDSRNLEADSIRSRPESTLIFTEIKPTVASHFSRMNSRIVWSVCTQRRQKIQ